MQIYCSRFEQAEGKNRSVQRMRIKKSIFRDFAEKKSVCFFDIPQHISGMYSKIFSINCIFEYVLFELRR